MSLSARPAPVSTPRPSRAGRLVVAAVVTLALVGAVLAAGLVLSARARPVDAALGERVSTSGGTFVVTRAETTFVPSTQGPPTAAKMAGTVGTEQLQVWVELAAARGDDLPFSEDQFRLVTADGTVRPADGSNLEDGVLQDGGAISAQLWFDEVESVEGGRLEYTAPGGRLVQVPLDAPEDAPAPTRPAGHGHG